jgi:hypothetical protein
MPTRGVIQEPLEYVEPARGVRDLGVELHAVQAALGSLEAGDRGGRGGRGHGEAGRRGGDRVPVRHPDLLRRRQVGEQHAGVDHAQPGAAVLGNLGAFHPATEGGGHRLVAVADAQRRYAGLEQADRHRRRPRRVDRLRAAGKDDGLGPARQHLLDRHGVRHDLAVDVALPHPPRDQLGVLRAEVDDEDGVESVWETGHSAAFTRRAGPAMVGRGPHRPIVAVTRLSAR